MMITSEDILKTEYIPEFDALRKNRMVASFHKYGHLCENYGGGRVDAIKSMQMCMDAFEEDHNLEHLVDAANYLMIRFKYPMPGEYFKWTDSSAGIAGVPINMEREVF